MADDAAELQIRRRDDLAAPRAQRRRRVVTVVVGFAVAFIAWEVGTSIVNYTGDAYVRSDLVEVAPQVTGPVVAVDVVDNQTVRKGERLFEIDPTPYRFALDAEAASLRAATAQRDADRDAAAATQDQLAAANAALQLAQETQFREAQLERQHFASQADLDAANEVLRRASADVNTAKAAVARAQEDLARDTAAIARAAADVATAQWRLDRTQVFAPVDGDVNNLTLRAGDTARADMPMVGVVDAHAWRIVANYKQYYLRGFRVGGTAWVWLDSHPWHLYRAHIQGIARGISRDETPRGLLPYVAPTTDWIRLQRRFPVTLLLDKPPPDLTLFMGADARVVIFQ
jgi:membrane fusion protein, multidrug efflux system